MVNQLQHPRKYIDRKKQEQKEKGGHGPKPSQARKEQNKKIKKT